MSSMPAKTAILYSRIEQDIKAQAEGILAELGVPVSSAISMFYKQVILHHGFPFKVKLPAPAVPDVSAMSEAKLDEALDKGYRDMLAGRTKPVLDAFDEIWKDCRA